MGRLYAGFLPSGSGIAGRTEPVSADLERFRMQPLSRIFCGASAAEDAEPGGNRPNDAETFALRNREKRADGLASILEGFRMRPASRVLHGCSAAERAEPGRKRNPGRPGRRISVCNLKGAINHGELAR